MRLTDRLPFAVAGGVLAVAALLPMFGLQDPVHMDVAHRLAPPSAEHWLGLDEYGRDELSRLLWGGRVSLFVALASATLSAVVGVTLGLVGGYFRGAAEFLTVRSQDVVQCFPPLLLALLVVTLLGPGASTLIPILAIVFLPSFVRITYAGVLTVRGQDYVEAMRTLGAGDGRILLRTVLPNVVGPVIVQFSLAMAAIVMLESGLSFLGLGVTPPTPSWGLMIGSARSMMAQAPQLLLWPSLALSLTVLGLNTLCDRLRDLLDPRGLTVPARRRVGPRSAATAADAADPDALLDIRGLTVEIDTPAGPIRPVRDLSLRVARGETLGIVGESGSGKSLTGLAVMGLLPPAARIAAGSIRLEGREITDLDDEAMRSLRGRTIAMVFQDPLSCLNPVHRIGRQIGETIRAHARIGGRRLAERVVHLMERVGIPDARRRAEVYPHEMSGGMRQRAMIAMAVANRPRLLVADEPTTALDVTIQAQVLQLLDEVKREDGMGMVFVTHALPVVADIADRVVVMYAGEIVESGPTRAVFETPAHPYTAALLACEPPEDGSLPTGLGGTVPPPAALPAGCLFAPRCGHRRPVCEAAPPPIVEVAPGRTSRCLRRADVLPLVAECRP